MLVKPVTGVDVVGMEEHVYDGLPSLASAEDTRWANGVNVWGYPEDTPTTWDPCSAATFRTKNQISTGSLPRFDSFGIYLPIVCTTSNIGDFETFSQRAARTLEATQAFAVEQALSQGTGVATNPFFGDSNVSVLAGGGLQSIATGFAYLEDAISATGRAGVIHAPPSVVTAGTFLLEKTEQGQIMTVNGTEVASGDGYRGATANGLTAGAGNAWIFATGYPEVVMTDMQLIPSDIRQTLSHFDNEVIVRAEKYVLAMWDTALQAAVKVKWAV